MNVSCRATTRPRKVIMPNGDVHDCRVIDVSLSGASISSPLRPQIGTAVVLGRMRGHVVRHHGQGWAIQFAALQDPAASPNPSASRRETARSRAFGPLSFSII